MAVIDLKDRIEALYVPSITEHPRRLRLEHAIDVCERRIWLRSHWAITSERSPAFWRRRALEEADAKRLASELRAIGYSIGSESIINISPRISVSASWFMNGGKRTPLMVGSDTIPVGIVAHAMGLKHGYMLDNDAIHDVPASEPEHDRVCNRVERIVQARRAPEIAEGAPCDGCQFNDLCHGSRLSREVNCRSCAHARTDDSGEWRCNAGHNADEQDGCPAHVLHPSLVPWELDKENSTRTFAAWRLPDGRILRNGDPDADGAHVFESREIIADPAVCLAQDATIEALRTRMGARIESGD